MDIRWRTRVGIIGFVYFCYFGASLIGAILASTSDDAKPSLVIVAVVAALHFTTASVGMLFHDRVALRSGVLKTTLVSDWLYAFALGLVSVLVSRESAHDERLVAVLACSLVATANVGCFYKSFHLLDPDTFDQSSGEPVDVL